MQEFDITLRIRVEAKNMNEADTIADCVVSDLKDSGNTFVDRPINKATWDMITPAAIDESF